MYILTVDTSQYIFPKLSQGILLKPQDDDRGKYIQ